MVETTLFFLVIITSAHVGMVQTTRWWRCEQKAMKQMNESWQEFDRFGASFEGAKARDQELLGTQLRSLFELVIPSCLKKRNVVLLPVRGGGETQRDDSDKKGQVEAQNIP